MGRNRQAAARSNREYCPVEVTSEYSLGRRTFLQFLGSGMLISVADPLALAQGGSSALAVSARIHLDADGTITAMSGKVEEGQGPRAELSQAAAEELRVPVDRVRLVMADTDLVPDDGITAGSRTTPRNVPEMRQAAATARELLTELAAERWKLEAKRLEVREARIVNPVNGEILTYSDLANAKELVSLFAEAVRSDVAIAPVGEWKVMGQSVGRPNGRDLVTGAHKFPSDIARPGMLHGKVLRPPVFGATLDRVDLTVARELEQVVAVRSGSFVGVAAPSTQRAVQALEAVARTATWKSPPQTVSHGTVHAHLREKARKAEARADTRGSVDKGLAEAKESLTAEYTVAYIQHAPMEPRAAVAEWSNGKLTVWAGCDGPFRARRDLIDEFGLAADQVRVIIPDMGGGFGGKHSAEAALEAARIAKEAGRPVSVRWTREEEFTWAYCRPAAVIECKAGLSSTGALTAWEFTNINAGGSAIDTPYDIPNTRISSVSSESPLRQGSYRCLAATGNNFARESFMDELAAAAGSDPLDFRQAHLSNERLRVVLEEAARRFDWRARKKRVNPEIGVGLACGTEKNSVVAACVEVGIDRKRASIEVLEICEVFECGPIINPANLTSQVEGCIVMGLGGALTEELLFENGMIKNPKFSAYRVPRFKDVPKISVHLLNNPNIPPAGGGETPIIAVAPAIGNAVFAATGVRLRSMPMRVETLRQG